MTIPELMEEQRARVHSSVPAERFAAALLLSGVLTTAKLTSLGHNRPWLLSVTQQSCGGLANSSLVGNHPILDELEIPRTGMHAFRRGRISEWVYNNVNRQVIRDWAGHGSDKLIDLYTKKMWEYHSPEMSKVKPLLELNSNWTQAEREESGTIVQAAVK